MAINTVVESVRHVDYQSLSAAKNVGKLLHIEALGGRIDLQEKLDELRIPVDPSNIRFEIRLSYPVDGHSRTVEKRLKPNEVRCTASAT